MAVAPRRERCAPPQRGRACLGNAGPSMARCRMLQRRLSFLVFLRPAGSNQAMDHFSRAIAASAHAVNKNHLLCAGCAPGRTAEAWVGSLLFRARRVSRFGPDSAGIAKRPQRPLEFAIWEAAKAGPLPSHLPGARAAVLHKLRPQLAGQLPGPMGPCHIIYCYPTTRLLYRNIRDARR